MSYKNCERRHFPRSLGVPLGSPPHLSMEFLWGGCKGPLLPLTEELFDFGALLQRIGV